MNTKTFFVNFINQAEKAFLRVANTMPEKEKFIEINGVDLRSTPPQFDQPEKIFRFFQQYWSNAFSNRMLCNLKVAVIKGRTYVLLGDATAPNEVVRLRILKSTPGFVLLEALLDPGRSRVCYLLKKTAAGRFTIIRRSILDYRYTACSCIISPIRLKN